MKNRTYGHVSFNDKLCLGWNSVSRVHLLYIMFLSGATLENENKYYNPNGINKVCDYNILMNAGFPPLHTLVFADLTSVARGVFTEYNTYSVWFIEISAADGFKLKVDRSLTKIVGAMSNYVVLL